jgi:hypothetical protein
MQIAATTRRMIHSRYAVSLPHEGSESKHGRRSRQRLFVPPALPQGGCSEAINIPRGTFGMYALPEVMGTPR